MLKTFDMEQFDLARIDLLHQLNKKDAENFNKNKKEEEKSKLDDSDDLDVV